MDVSRRSRAYGERQALCQARPAPRSREKEKVAVEWSTSTGIAKFLLGAAFWLAFAPSLWAQGFNPGDQRGQPPLTEGQSPMQNDGDPAGAEQEQPLGEVGGVEIDSDPNAPEDANSIMNDSSNIGMPSPDEE